MQRICGANAAWTGKPCGNVVADGEDHCRAGHKCEPAADAVQMTSAEVQSVGPLTFDLEEVILGAAA